MLDIGQTERPLENIELEQQLSLNMKKAHCRSGNQAQPSPTEAPRRKGNALF